MLLARKSEEMKEMDQKDKEEGKKRGKGRRKDSDEVENKGRNTESISTYYQ